MIMKDCVPQAFVLIHMVSISAIAKKDVKEIAESTAQSQALLILSPYLVCLSVIVAKLHLLLHPQFALISLMRQYRFEGISVQGQVLSCEARPGPSGGDGGGDKFVAEIMYEKTEHRNARDPSLKFRNPGDLLSKRFVRRLEIGRKVERGGEVEVLCLPGDARSGLPREVVDGTLADHDKDRGRAMRFLSSGIALCAIFLGLAVRAVLQMDDVKAGWMALMISVCVIEAVPFLYCTDQFLKSKKRRFNWARPMQLAKSGKVH